MSTNAREAILDAARASAQAHGYDGLNFRDLAAEVGIKSASLYYHFPGKAELGAAVARRYWEDSAAELEALADRLPDPRDRLAAWPALFRRALASGNRICLCSVLAAEIDNLPDIVTAEVRRFSEINIAWLERQWIGTGLAQPEAATRAAALFAAIAGAQLLARGRAEIALFDALVDGYRTTGLLPAAPRKPARSRSSSARLRATPHA